MNQTTTTPSGQDVFCLVCSSRHHDAPNCSFVDRGPATARPVFLRDFTIYPQAGEIYAHNECELFHVQDLTIDDLARLYQDLKTEIGEALADEVMEQLTANK